MNNAFSVEKVRNPSSPSYKDTLWGFLFIAQVVVVIGLAFSFGITALESTFPKTVTIVNDNSEIERSTANSSTKIIGGLFVLLFLGMSVSAVLSYGIARASSKLLFVSFSVTFAVTIAVSIGFFVSRSPFIGALGILFALILMAYYKSIRPRLEFAATNLSVASKAVMVSPTIFLLALLMLAVQVFWSLLWFVALLGVATNEANPTFTYNGHTYSANQCTTYEYSSSVHVNGQLMTCSAGTCYACVCDTTTVSQSSCYRTQLQFGPLIGMLLSFFWTSSVLSNIVHCAAAGAVAHWWFSEHVNNSWTKSTFNRACTTSLGSIALGSMFIAIVRTVRWVVAACAESFKYPSDNAIVSRVKSCMHSFFDMLLGLIERGLSFFSKFALCYVAVYGDSFIESSRAVATLFTQKGWTALVNDDIVDSMLFCCNCAVGLLCMLVGYMYGLSVGLDSANCSLLTVLGLVGGMMMSMVVSRIMSSAVATVFVCFAEDHTALELTHPEDYKMLSDAWIDCNCHPAVCAAVDAENGASGYTPTFPKSYVANRGTYKPPSEYMQLPSSEDPAVTKQAVYEQFSRTHSFPRDEEDEETVTF